MSITAGLHSFTDFLQRGGGSAGFWGFCVRDVTQLFQHYDDAGKSAKKKAGNFPACDGPGFRSPSLVNSLPRIL